MFHKLDVLMAKAIVLPLMIYLKALYSALARLNSTAHPEDRWAVDFLGSPEIRDYLRQSTSRFGLVGSFFHRADLWEMAWAAAAAHVDRVGPDDAREVMPEVEARLRRAGRLPS